MSYIFISYSHKDKDYVHKLQEALQNEGSDVWIDDRSSQQRFHLQKRNTLASFFIDSQGGNNVVPIYVGK